MVTVHRIPRELFEDSFDLIALHSTMEGYAMAYHINQVAQIVLARAREDLKIADFSHPVYEYRDDVKGEAWYLVQNVSKEEKHKNEGLFQNSTTIKLNYLLEERKEIDYIVKLYPQMAVAVEKTISAIRTIPKVSMAYKLNADDLKSKKNLIF